MLSSCNVNSKRRAQFLRCYIIIYLHIFIVIYIFIYQNSERRARPNFRSVSRRRNRPQRFSHQFGRLLAQFGICYSVNTFPSNCLSVHYIYMKIIYRRLSHCHPELIYFKWIPSRPIWNPFHPQASTLSITIMQQMQQEEGRGAGEIFNTRSLPEYIPWQTSIQKSNFQIISAKCIWDYYGSGRNMKPVFRISASSSMITWLAKEPEEMSLHKVQ